MTTEMIDNDIYNIILISALIKIFYTIELLRWKKFVLNLICY